MIIVKIGGGKDINTAGVAGDLASIGEAFVVVHGANAVRDEIAARLGHPTRTVTSVSGYASVLSDEKAIDAIMMGYAGIQNKRLVELFQQHGVNAVGLSGIDGRLVRGARNKGIRVRQNEKTLLLHDFSGKPRSINKGLVTLLLDHGYVPVICIPILDEQNCAINSENDDIVTVLQEGLRADTIVQLIEAPGFMEDINDASSLVQRISPAELTAREAQVEGRMKRKMLALRKLMENGARRVIISDGRAAHPIEEALNGKGTIIQ